MTAALAPDVTDQCATHIIRRAARRLVEKGTFPRSDLEDVVQELRLALVCQAENFDPERARWSTFVRNVVRNTAVSLQRREQAQRRKGDAEVASLNVWVTGELGVPVELGAAVSEEEYRAGLGLRTFGHVEQVDHALDIQSVLDALPDDLRDIGERLKTHSPAEVRQALGISRTTMQRRLAALRERLLAAGIDRPI